MTVSTIAPPELAEGGRTARTIPAWGAGIALGFFGFLVSFIGIGNPSLWGREAASMMSADRPLPSLFRKLAWVGYGAGLNTLERFGFQQQNDKTVNRTTVHILTRGTL